MDILYSAICLFLKTFGQLWLRTKVSGKKPHSLPCKGPLIIAPTHASYIDPPLVASVWWPIKLDFFASRHLFEKRLLRHVIGKLRTHPVDRAQGVNALRQALKLLSEGKIVVLFPEGTRSRDGSLGSMKKGVALLSEKAHCPVIPVVIEGTYDFWPPNKKFPKLFVKKSVKIHIGEPLEPCPEGEEAYDAWLEKLKQAYLSLKKR